MREVNSRNLAKMYHGNKGRLGIPLNSQTKQPMNAAPPQTIGAMTLACFHTRVLPPW